MENMQRINLGRLRLDTYLELVKAVAAVKKAAARGNAKCGRISKEKAEAIAAAADKLAEGGSALEQLSIYRVMGSPLNGAANDWLAKEAAERSGLEITAAEVNASQTPTDVSATVANLTAIEVLQELKDASGAFAEELRSQAGQFADVVKCGRVMLQDSLPVNLGKEFEAWAHAMDRCRGRIEQEIGELSISLLGAGDVGTSLDVPEGFPLAAADELSRATGLLFKPDEDFMDGITAVDRLCSAHACIQSLAVACWRIMHDLEFLSSGPRAGIREIALPAVAPGSSIMPGKINPTMAQLGALLADSVSSNAAALASSLQSGWLAEGMRSTTPIKMIMDSGILLARAMLVTKKKLIHGITALKLRALNQAEDSAALVVVVEKALGAEAAEKAARRMETDGCSCRDALVRERILSEEKASRLLDVAVLSTPGKNTALIEAFRNS